MVEDTTPIPAKREAVPASVAARDSSVTDVTMRRWLADGVVDGYVVQRGSRKRHFVYRDSVERLRQGIPSAAEEAAPEALARSAANDSAAARATLYEGAFNLAMGCIDELVTALTADDSTTRDRSLGRAFQLQNKIISQFAPVNDELMR